MPQKVHVIHGRDHEHGGPDPLNIHWEDVGTNGGGGTGGIQFGTYPQDGNWLYIKATSSRDMYEGIHLEATTLDPDFRGRIALTASHEIKSIAQKFMVDVNPNLDATDQRAFILMYQHGATGWATLEAEGILNLGSSSQVAIISGERVDYTGPYMKAADANLVFYLNAAPSGLRTGYGLVVRDNSPLNLGELLKIKLNAAGTGYEFHMKTGATWVADL